MQDLALSSDASRLVAMNCENHVYVYNFVTREMQYEIDFKTPLSSVDISYDSRYLLIKKSNGEIRMLDIETRETIREFGEAGKPSTVVIRSSFGGANESFVITGSESMSSISTQGAHNADKNCSWKSLHLPQGNGRTSGEARSP